MESPGYLRRKASGKWSPALCGEEEELGRAVLAAVMEGSAGGLLIRTTAYPSPPRPLSACLWSLSAFNSCIGPLRLFTSTSHTKLFSYLWYSEPTPLTLSTTGCLLAQPCWSFGATRNAGCWISRWQPCISRHGFQSNTGCVQGCSPTWENTTTTLAHLTYFLKTQLSNRGTTPRLTSGLLKTGMSTCSDLTANKNISLA